MNAMVSQGRDEALGFEVLQHAGGQDSRLADHPPTAADAPEALGGHAGADLWTLICILDAIDYGVLLLDAQARVYHANLAARRSCSSGQGLVLVDDHVRPHDPHDGRAFHVALQECARGRRRLLAATGEHSMQDLALIPLAGVQTGPSILLLMGRHDPCQPLSTDFFARTHRLTTAESTVLRYLCNGQRPGDVARLGGVSISTVRTQINSIRAKTATASIGELVRRVMALPPIMPVVDLATRSCAGLFRS